MQNNVTDLSQKLQRSLDNNYNVIDMPAVIEIISTLEKISVTKELLETTRLGKYINELRRRTSNEALAKRAKDLLKKWRDLILPEANGQVRASSQNSSERSDSPDPAALKSRKRPARDLKLPDQKLLLGSKRPTLNGQIRELDLSDNSNCSVKDLKKTDVIFINSDSNSSMPDQSTENSVRSHSTNDTPTFDEFTAAQPKKRGRKKGSKNHKNLVIAAEESFSNKMAMSKNSKVKTTQELLADLQNRAVSKQNQDIELRAAQLTESLSRIDQKLNPQRQINKNLLPLAKTDKLSKTSLAAPKVKVETDVTVAKGKTSSLASDQWSLGRTSPEVVVLQSDDEIVDVCSIDTSSTTVPVKQSQTEVAETAAVTSTITTTTTTTTSSSSSSCCSTSQTVEDILRQLPPVDVSVLGTEDSMPECICPLPQVTTNADKITVEIVGGNDDTKFSSPLLSYTNSDTCPPLLKTSCDSSEIDSKPKPEPQPPDVDPALLTDSEVSDCPARLYLRSKYDLDTISDHKVIRLQNEYIPNVNGNWGLCSSSSVSEPAEKQSELFENIVPNMSTERLRRDLTLKHISTACENYNKYSISITNSSDDKLSEFPEMEANCELHEASSRESNKNSSLHDTSRRDNLCDIERTESVAKLKPNVTDEFCSSLSDNQHREFREWHETVDVSSYNGETLRILPYVIID